MIQTNKTNPTDSTNFVRENWLSTREAVKEVVRFERRFGKKHLKLSCYAALPLILTPELLNLIRINFLSDQDIPWVAEVDFLLSSLCRPIGEGLYEVEPSIREVLMVELENTVGSDILFNIASFLQAYVVKPNMKTEPEVIKTLSWIAKAYLNPDEVVKDIAQSLNKSESEQDLLPKLQGQLQVVMMLEVLEEPLASAQDTEAYQTLVLNCQKVTKSLYGKGDDDDDDDGSDFNRNLVISQPIHDSFVEVFGGGTGIRFTVRNLKLNGEGNTLTLEQDDRVEATLEINHDCSECGGAINQIIVGLAGEKQAQACVWIGGGSSNGWQTVSFSLTIPNTVDVYYIRTRYAQASNEQDALGWWTIDRPDGPTETSNIGAIVVQGVAPPVFFEFEFNIVSANRRGEIIQQETKTAQYFTETLSNNVTLEMVSIPGGTFMMGSPEDEAERQDNESPQHEVTVPPFFMGKYPVTQAQWRVVAALPQINRELKPDPSNFKGDDLPVEQISWYEAVEFCDRLSKQTNRDYRLPSEAEWEYACRAGTTTPFHFGETITPDLANYNADYTYGDAHKGKSVNQTTQVGKFKVANSFGLYDMHANVEEWCYDHWHDNYKGAPVNGSAWVDEGENNENDNQIRLLRGGSWGNAPGLCRSASRSWCGPALRNDAFGFRVVVSAART